MTNLMRSTGHFLKHVQRFLACKRSASLKVNQELPYGWRVVKSIAVPELNLSNAVHLQHTHCNAQWLHMENQADPANAFSIHFKTVPRNSTGVAHILEHVTLCGSEKFPVRDPFMKMLNRSLATMNAMTGPDYTLYPFATPNRKDFYNMLQVYLDAVFNPLLREMDFKQEGWRLDLDDKSGELAIKGVVFNEMKGAFADAQQILGQQLLNKLMPSDTYSICSGGLPECIPQLSWEELKKFHSVHYSPNNARFYSYGDIPLEQHLEAVHKYLPPLRQINTQGVAEVPNEPRWSTPRRAHIDCPTDPSGASNTFSISFLTCPIENIYETFVLRVVTELLTEGPSAPLYKSLIESGLGKSFSPISGFDSSTKDTAFTIGLQGINMDKVEEIEAVVLKTLRETADLGFEADRVQAILNRTELSLKKQVNEFGWRLILSITAGWNHVHDPLSLLSINPIIEKFKMDYQGNDKFLQSFVQKFLLDNNHRLTLTMAPRDGFQENQQATIDAIEKELVSQLTDEQKQTAIEQGKQLERMQSTKESEDLLSCLPTLSMADIPTSLPRHSGISEVNIGQVKGQSSVQPTNELAYVKIRLNYDKVLSPEEKQILPLFTSIMTSMGAHDKSYRDLDTLMDLYTGGMGSSIHLSESPNNVSQLNQRGLMLTSMCLEKYSDKMFSLWEDIFRGLLVPHDGQEETSYGGLKARLTHLISMSAVGSTNGIAHGGHHYAMAHAASKLPGLTATAERENQSGISMIRLLHSIAEDESRIEGLLREMTVMSRKLLHSLNIETFSVSATKADVILGQMENLFSSIPKYEGTASVQEVDQTTTNELKNTYISAPFPVHFCSAALLGAPGYTHPDSAPLRVLSRLLSSKYLHVEIREKGGAYGGGCSSSPTTGVISFYSYRDPNFERTLSTFGRCNGWIQDSQSFKQRDVDEAKLNIFKAVDTPVLPGARGQRLFLSGITDHQFEEHRQRLRSVSIEDVRRVSEKYLGHFEHTSCSTVIGPESSAKNAAKFTIEDLLAAKKL